MERGELERRLRILITGCTEPPEDCSHCHCGNEEILRIIDVYTAAAVQKALQLRKTELWAAEQVAAHLGLGSIHHARTTMSRAQISGVMGKHPVTGKRASLYPAHLVRALKDRRRRAS